MIALHLAGMTSTVKRQVISCLGCYADRIMEMARGAPETYPLSHALYTTAVKNATCALCNDSPVIKLAKPYGLGHVLRLCGMYIMQGSPSKEEVRGIHAEAAEMGLQYEPNEAERKLQEQDLEEERVVDEKRRSLGESKENEFKAWHRDVYTPAMIK